MQLVQGVTVAGTFRLVHELGRGAMGAVWRAHHLRLNVPCALKFISADAARAPSARARFEQEAQAAAQLRSPHVVQVFDHGLWEGVPYIAMELLEGEDLEQRLKRAGRLEPRDTAAIVSQIARALEKAHEAGLVHRDLKPANVFLVRDGPQDTVKILDFGIAKRVASFDGVVTNDGAFLGSPCYMSPEQARNSRAVDYRSDLWSLAVIAFECLTGCRPFEADNLGELLAKIGSEPLPVPSRLAPWVPADFDAWWARAAQREPGARFPSARAMAEALGQVAGVTLSSPELRAAPGVTPSVLPSLAPPAAAQLTQTSPGGAMTASTVGWRAPTGAPKRALAWLAAGALVVGVTIAVSASLSERPPPAVQAPRSAGEGKAAPQSLAAAGAPPPVEAAGDPAPPATADVAPAAVPSATAPTAGSGPAGARPRPPRPASSQKRHQPSQESYDDGI